MYVDDPDRLEFLEVMQRVVKDELWNLLSYCLMGNHYHLIVEVPSGDLATGMRRLNSTYAIRFNQRHGYEGHLFERRYRCYDLKHEQRLLAAIGYVGRNPVRAGLCNRARDWPWSSVGAAIGERRCPSYLNVERLWALVGPTPEAAKVALREMYDEDREPPPAEALREVIRQYVDQAHSRDGLSVQELADALDVPTASVLKLMR